MWCISRFFKVEQLYSTRCRLTLKVQHAVLCETGFSEVLLNQPCLHMSTIPPRLIQTIPLLSSPTLHGERCLQSRCMSHTVNSKYNLCRAGGNHQHFLKHFTHMQNTAWGGTHCCIKQPSEMETELKDGDGADSCDDPCIELTPQRQTSCANGCRFFPSLTCVLLQQCVQLHVVFHGHKNQAWLCSSLTVGCS